MLKKEKRLSTIEIISELRRPLRAERKSKIESLSRTPSFQNHINHWLGKASQIPHPKFVSERLDKIKHMFKDYTSQNIDERKKTLQRCEAILNEASTHLFLNKDVQYIKGVGPKRASDLHKLGIYKAGDLLRHFPRRYEDRSKFTKIAEAKVGDYVTLRGEIRARNDSTRYGRTKLTKAIIDDGTGRITGVWFNQPYMKNLLPVGKKIILSGRVSEFSGKQITHPVFELSEKNDPVHTGRIVPLYSLTKGIGMRYLRTLVDRVLKEPQNSLAEYLPENLVYSRELMGLEEAARNIHFPKNTEDKEKARTRFIYEEFLFLQIGLLIMRALKKEGKGIKFDGKTDLAERLEQVLPFRLTNSQKKVLNNIKADMTSPKRMMRLLHGEVGSGKTVVALGAILLAKDSGYQSAVMAPTAILAEQHYLTLQKYALSLGMEIGLIISGQGEEERREILKRTREGSVDVLIGTHALLQEEVKFKKLGLAVIDEEHKFGVLQRAHFSSLFDKRVEILVMSATPIPRSLALALYGDMDVSKIDELPPGRAQTLTFWVEAKDTDNVYDFIKEELDKNRQAFIVTPLIEESEKLEANSAKKIFETLQSKVFNSSRLALLHGKIKKDEQKRIMEDFRDKKTDILVATSLIEVGIDIPSATVMLVLNAERFGLAQLHQLRGRIGRGEHNSYCILVSSPRTQEGKKRLEAMVSTSDGFEIAAEDLEIRGPGEILGTQQHGFPEMKLGNILKDLKLLQQARKDAQKLLRETPALEDNTMMKDILLDRFPYIQKILPETKAFNSKKKTALS